MKALVAGLILSNALLVAVLVFLIIGLADLPTQLENSCKAGVDAGFDKFEVIP